MTLSANKMEWRNISVERDNDIADPIITKLVKNSETAIFQTGKELMVFAAMIGYCFDKKKTLTTDIRKRTSITLGTYAHTDHDGFIYLLALIEKKNAIFLKNASINESIKIFEQYCNGGLDLINDWFRNDPTDIAKLDTLWEKIDSHLQSQELVNIDVFDEEALVNENLGNVFTVE